MGMGRGSRVGSLVAYSLILQELTRLKRAGFSNAFLNRDVTTMPDIDIDIPDLYRPELARHVRDRYGSQHVVQIVTLFDLWQNKQFVMFSNVMVFLSMN